MPVYKPVLVAYACLFVLFVTACGKEQPVASTTPAAERSPAVQKAAATVYPALAGVFASGIFSGTRFVFNNVQNVATFTMFYGSRAQRTCVYGYAYNPAAGLVTIAARTFAYGFCAASGTYQVGYNGGGSLVIYNLRFFNSPQTPVSTVGFVRLQ